MDISGASNLIIEGDSVNLTCTFSLPVTLLISVLFNADDNHGDDDDVTLTLN